MFAKLKNKHIFLLITFIVAFCSIVYELIFAQLLNIVFGATVVQYSLVIGFFMFALGLGSFAVEYLVKGKDKKKQEQIFIFVEMAITFTAIFGSALILSLSAFVSTSLWFNILLEILAFVPVVIVGFLSGAELPLLVYLYDKDAFTQVLGTDYFGSLLGTVAYSLIILPSLGIVSTTVFIASLNIFLALLFALFVHKRHKKLYMALFVITVFFFSFYFTSQDKFNKYFESLYLSKVVENVYREYGVDDVKAFVSDVLNTPYQQAIEYDIVFMASTPYANADHCLNLDRHLQACGNWTESYHHGLVDVPISVLKRDSLDVLILGGGDFIPAAFLQKFDDRIAKIDMVDIDAKFQDYAKHKSAFLKKYNKESYKYKKLNVHVADAFHYLKNNDKKYDLILFDLPGIKHDKLLPLYSKEMFTFINRSLKDDGIFVSWFYPKDMFPKHAKVIENTLLSAGFKKRLDYIAYNATQSGAVQETERFFVLPKSGKFNNTINSRENPYSKRFAKRYAKSKWYNMQEHKLTRINSVFRPNRDILAFNPIVIEKHEGI